MPRIPLTDAERVRLTQLLAQGLSLPLAARQLDRPYPHVLQAAKKMGLKLNGRAYVKRPAKTDLPAEQLALIGRVAESGQRAQQLAEQLGVNWRTLSQELRGLRVMRASRIVALKNLLGA